MSLPFPRRLLGCLLGIAISSLAVAQDELYLIAEALASPIFSSSDAALEGFDDNVVMLRQELAYQQLARLTSTTGPLDAYRRQRLADYAACNQSLQTLRRLDSNVPDFEGVVTKTLAASPGLYKAARANFDGETATYNEYDRESLTDLAEKALTELFKAGYNAYQASEERTNYRKRYQTARANSLALEGLLREHIESPPCRSYGMGCVVSFSEDGGTVLVSNLLDGSPAQQAGLLAGDQLILAGGRALSRETFQEILGVRATPQTRPLNLVARRDGKTHLFSLKRDMPIAMPVFSVDVDGAFDGFYSSDFVHVQNVSGRDLTNVVLFVDLKGRHGASAAEASDRHMHYVRNWPNSETRVLRYLSTAVSGIAANESVDQIEKVQFRLYSDQITDSQDYHYSAEAFTEDVKRYLDDLQFTARWYSYSDDHLLYDSGVTIKTANGSSFPATSMTLTVTSGTTTKSVKYDIENDIFDGDQYFSHSKFNGMSVDRIDVSFDLPYTDHSVDVYWTY